MITHKEAEDIKYMAENYRAFQVSYISMTNHRPARIKIIDLYYGDSIIVSFPSGKDSPHYTTELAIAVLLEMGITVTGRAEGKGNYILLADNFITRIV